MTGCLSNVRRLSRPLVALCLVLGSQSAVAGQSPDGAGGARSAPAAQAQPAATSDVGSVSAADSSESENSRVSERLRHKDRATASTSPEPAGAHEKAPDDPVAAQHRESDMDFTGTPAKKSRVPQHSPEWTNPKSGDPGRSEPGEKGGTTDINIGVGEDKSTDADRPEPEQNAGDG